MNANKLELIQCTLEQGECARMVASGGGRAGEGRVVLQELELAFQRGREVDQAQVRPVSVMRGNSLHGRPCHAGRKLWPGTLRTFADRLYVHAAVSG